MKRTFTLTILALLASATVSAQGYRKWDFTHWSAQTVANLMADAAASSTVGWSDIEKAADAGEGKVAPEATAGKCFWYDSSEGGALKANGVPITELEGLDFGSTYCDNRSLAIAVNYPVGHGGTYRKPHGGEFSIPAVAWLDWQLKGNKEASKMFVGKDCGILKRKDWTIEKNSKVK